MFEHAVVVTIDDTGISATYPSGDIQRIPWDEVEQVTIETNDSGPWGADVWWILSGADRRCIYPNGATGEQDALAEFPRRFPQFSNKAVIEALCCTSNKQFVCWKRKHAF